jgi:hypothetical protein
VCAFIVVIQVDYRVLGISLVVDVLSRESRPHLFSHLLDICLEVVLNFTHDNLKFLVSLFVARKLNLVTLVLLTLPNNSVLVGSELGESSLIIFPKQIFVFHNKVDTIYEVTNLAADTFENS